MRKCIFYLTVFYLGAVVFCQELSFSVSKMNLAFKAKGIEACVAWKIPSFTFDQSPEKQTPCWGFSWNTASVSQIPVKLSVGQLTCAGALSRLKSPALSSYLSPFGYSAGSASAFLVSLPSSCVSSRPEALSLGLDYNKTKGFLRKISITQFTDKMGAVVEGGSLSLWPFPKTELSFGVTSGLFTIEHTGSEWFSENQYFQNYVQIPVCMQFGFSRPEFKSRETLCIFPGFSGKIGYTFSTENTLILKNILKAGDFFLNYSSFNCSDSDIFTASSSHLKVLSQYKINPYVCFYPANKFRLRIGTGLYGEEKINNKEIEVNVKFAQGLNLQGKKSSGTITFNANGKKDSGGEILWENCSCGIKVSGSGKVGTVGGCSVSWNPDFSKITYKGNGKLSFHHFPLTSLSCDLQINQRNSEVSSSRIGISSGFRLNKKSLTVSGTAGILLNL